ncbi:MAG: hypothetical protein MUO80_08730 [Dehalococcoidia bacterium]|nr:hypothetical protein [Dehalococcoidia bacterium]
MAYIDSQNRVVEIQDPFEGTLNANVIYPRRVIQGALNIMLQP